MAQVNFNIPDELKEELDRLMSLSGAETKPEFMQQMVMALNNHIANSADIDIDLSKYENVNNQTKEAVSDIFRHLLTVLDNNFSTTKQEAIYIESEKRLLAEREEAYKAELEAVKAETNEKLLDAEKGHKLQVAELQESKAQSAEKVVELQNKNDELIRELESVSRVADQVQSVMSENKELREQMKCDAESFKEEIKEIAAKADVAEAKLKAEIEEYKSNIESIQSQADQLEKESFKNSIELQQATKQIEELKAQLDKQTVELLETRAELNKALGKLEVIDNTDQGERHEHELHK